MQPDSSFEEICDAKGGHLALFAARTQNRPEFEGNSGTPGTYIKSFPPTVMFHGLADVTVPPESSADFLTLLRDANIPSELHTFAGVPHEFVGIPEFAESTAQLADFFLERHVISPRTYPAFGAGRRGGGEAGRGGRQ